MGETHHPEQKTLYNLYALFAVSLVLCVVPQASAAMLCLVFFTWLLIAAYIIRRKAEENSLTHNHTTYIIRSLWIGALISMLTTIAASLYMLKNISYEPFQPCANVIAGKGVEALQAMSMMEVYAMAEPCVEGFISFNRHALVMAVLIAAAPALLYMSYRFIRGVSRAVKGYRLANPKSWV